MQRFKLAHIAVVAIIIASAPIAARANLYIFPKDDLVGLGRISAACPGIGHNVYECSVPRGKWAPVGFQNKVGFCRFKVRNAGDGPLGDRWELEEDGGLNISCRYRWLNPNMVDIYVK